MEWSSNLHQEVVRKSLQINFSEEIQALGKFTRTIISLLFGTILITLVQIL